MTKLVIENATKRYGDEVAVDDLSLSIEENNIKALLGPSGCGKTTTLRLVAGFEQLDSGKILIDDKIVSDADNDVRLPPQKRDIGMVFQSLAIWPHMTVEENLRFPLTYATGAGDMDHDEKIDDILETVGLLEYKTALTPNLSGGQRQRVALARALVTEPDIILFDEPLTALDSQLRRTLRNEINRICTAVDVTALYVTHSQDEAMYIADDVALMNDGRIIEEGRPEQLYRNPNTYFGMNFMGKSNRFMCSVRSVDGDSITLEPDQWEDEIVVEDGSGEFQPEQPVMMCFRPKACSINPDERTTGNGDAGVRFEGTITSRGVTRDFVEYTVDVFGQEVLVHAAPGTTLDVNDTPTISVLPNEIRLFAQSQEYEH